MLTMLLDALARIFVYSMSQDSVVRTDSSGVEGCLAGSKALDSLDKLVTGTETFFHPSNSGPWSIAVGLQFHPRAIEQGS